MERVINCVQCNTPFTLTKKHPNKRFCSVACACRANAIHRRLPPKECAWCGEVFTSLKSSTRFCSLQCAGKASNIGRVRMTLADRFWLNVFKSDTCWVWTGTLSTQGYGMISLKTRYRAAPRVSWELHYGLIPKGKEVCHSCDNPICVRPDHLFLGTHQENMDDMVAKSRHCFGERRKNHVLTDEKVREIRASPLSGIELARIYGVNQSVISRVRARKIWKHVE